MAGAACLSRREMMHLFHECSSCDCQATGPPSAPPWLLLILQILSSRTTSGSKSVGGPADWGGAAEELSLRPASDRRVSRDFSLAAQGDRVRHKAARPHFVRRPVERFTRRQLEEVFRAVRDKDSK